MDGRFARIRARSSRPGERGFERQSYASRLMNGVEPIEAVWKLNCPVESRPNPADVQQWARAFGTLWHCNIRNLESPKS